MSDDKLTNSANISQKGADSWHKIGTRIGTKLSQEKRRTAELTKSLPRGISIGEWKDSRPKPYWVRYGTPRKTESFALEVDRNDKAEDLIDAEENGGRSILNFDPKRWQAFVEWEKKQKPSYKVKQAVTEYIALRLTEDLVEKSDSHLHVRAQLGRLVQRFGEKQLDEVTTEELREWLPTIKGGKYGDKMLSRRTRRHHLKTYKVFWVRCVEEKWCQHNPCAVVKAPRVELTSKRKLEPRQIFDLFKANRNEPVIGRMALELFGGMRASSVERAQKEDINFKERGIFMHGAREDKESREAVRSHKSGKSHYREGHPEALWMWLEHAGDAAWTEIHERNYDDRKGEAFIRARVKNTGNVLRHSFASYMLAHTKSYEKVGHWMQHRNRQTTIGYEGIATEADAKLVLAITPESVLLTWDDFLRANAQL